jgi:hypothetical protein
MIELSSAPGELTPRELQLIEAIGSMLDDVPLNSVMTVMLSVLFTILHGTGATQDEIDALADKISAALKARLEPAAPTQQMTPAYARASAPLTS